MSEPEGAGSGDEVSFDVLVIGSGAGGMAAAATSALHGLSVLLVEKEAVIGGTTALSGGGLWVPGNALAHRAGVQDDPVEVRRYLQHEAGNHLDREVVDSFLANGPAMVSFFQERTDVAFISAAAFPDYHPDAPGAGVGRTLLTQPYDGRLLGVDLARLRRPLRQMTLAGITLASGDELWHFLRATRSARSAAYVAQVIGRYALDLARSGRGTRLTNGNALAARLFRTLLRLRVPLWEGTPATRLITEDGRVRGAVVQHLGQEVRVIARKGVVLACGGFPQDEALRSRLFPHASAGGHHSPAPPGNTGDGIRLGQSGGGALRTDLAHAAAWVPVSLIPQRDGNSAVFPHLIDRQKPGIIAVNARGRRFTNEAASYHDFVAALVASTPPGDEPFAWLLADRGAIRRYGLGFAKPFPLPLRPVLRSGYLRSGHTVAELASAIGSDPAALTDTIARFNADAARGRDSEFGRGGTLYNRFMGDPTHTPNPNLAPLETPPFYAVRMVVGDLGTFAGLRTDGSARVLDANGAPIPGLYAVGNDMASPLGGAYPGGGATLGPAMTFGYVAGRDIAGVQG